MITQLLILIIIILIIGFILFKIFKKLITTLISLSVIITIFLIIFLIFLYIDINNLQTNFYSSDNLIFLQENLDDNNIITGLMINLEKNNTIYLSKSEINSINPYKNNYYKTVLLNIQFLKNNLAEETEISNEKYLIKDQIISILRSKNPIEDFNSYTNQEIILQETDNIKFKAHIFSLLFKKIPFNLLLKEYKNDNIVIYPESITFKIIKLIPKAILNNIQ